MAKTPSWSDYLKEIAKRSRAGFASIHNELLQRYREISTRTVGDRGTTTKRSMTVTPDKVTSKLFGNKSSEKYSKLLENKDNAKIKGDTSKESFVSYVDKNCNEFEENGVKTATSSLSGPKEAAKINNVTITRTTRNTDKSLNAKKDKTVNEIKSGRTSESKIPENRAKTPSKHSGIQTKKIKKFADNSKKRGSVVSEESEYKVPVTGSCAVINSEGSEYKIPVTSSCVVINSEGSEYKVPVTSGCARTDSDSSVYKVPLRSCCAVTNGGPDGNLSPPFYKTCERLSDDDHIYDIPNNPNLLSKTGSSNGISETNSLGDPMSASLIENNIYANQQQIGTAAGKRKSDTDNDDENDEVFYDTESNSVKEKTLQYPSAEDKQDKLYENVRDSRQYPKTSKVASVTSPLKPLQNSSCESADTVDSSDSDDDYVIPTPREKACIDGDNEYVTHDSVVGAESKPRKSATVTPYISQTTTPVAAVLPRKRPFLMYTVEEVVECFKECALPMLAKVCKEEKLDGEYFKDLSDEDLSKKPFFLDHFHISKARKIIAGWRPKRLL